MVVVQKRRRVESEEQGREFSVSGFDVVSLGGMWVLERGAVWGRTGWDLVHGCGMCLEMAGM